MKGFKKLALVTAVAALPMSGFAMEALDDAALSGVTGQDGITISLGTSISADILIHDTDGFTGAGSAGAIVIEDFGITLPTGEGIEIAIDAGHDGVSGPALNVGVTLPDGIEIALGNVFVSRSNRTNTSTLDADWGDADRTAVMTLGTLTLGETNLNIQLGHEYQGAMMVMDTTIAGGIELTGFSVIDASSSESIGFDLALVGSGVSGGDLALDVTVDIDADGLVIGINQFGDDTFGADLRLARVTLGSTPALGDVEIQRLNLTGTVTISGH